VNVESTLCVSDVINKMFKASLGRSLTVLYLKIYFPQNYSHSELLDTQILILLNVDIIT